MSAWDRQTGEPSRAYAAFCRYRDLGPQERTTEKVGRISGFSATYAEQLSSRWKWIHRCDQWDAHIQQIYDRAFVTEAAKRGKQRAQAFTALLGKALQALQNVSIERESLKDVAAAMKVAAEGMRLEEGLETKRVSLEVTDARSIISRLPAEIRTGLLRALASNVAARGSENDSGGVPFGLDKDEGD